MDDFVEKAREVLKKSLNCQTTSKSQQPGMMELLASVR